MEKFIEMYYGIVPREGLHGVAYAERAHKIEVEFFSTKRNWRKALPLDDQINDRTLLKKAMLSHPDGNGKPTQYNQIFKL